MESSEGILSGTGICDPLDIDCIDAARGKYSDVPGSTTYYNPTAAANNRGLQMDANALAAAGLNSFTSSANTANAATTGGNPITAADILNLPLTEEAQRKQAVDVAMAEFLRVLAKQDQGLELARASDERKARLRQAYSEGSLSFDEYHQRMNEETERYDNQIANLSSNTASDIAAASQALKNLGVTREEINTWNASQPAHLALSPRIGEDATLFQKAGDVGADVLGAIAEATDWTGEALGSVLGIGDPDQFGPTVPNLGVGWQWGATGKQTPVRIGTAKDGTPIVIYMPGGGFLGGAAGAAQQEGTGIVDILRGGWEGMGGFEGILTDPSVLATAASLTDDDKKDTTKTGALIDNSYLNDDTVGGEGVVGEVTVSDPSKSKVETFSDAPDIGGLSTLPQDPNIGADIDALMTDPNIAADVDALKTKPAYAGGISTLEGEPNIAGAEVILGEKPAYKWGMEELKTQPDYTGSEITVSQEPSYVGGMDALEQEVLAAGGMEALEQEVLAVGDMEAIKGQASATGAIDTLEGQAAPQGRLVDDTVYTTTLKGNVGDAQETDSIRGSSVNVNEPSLRASSVNLEEATLRGSSPALKTSTLRGSSGGGGGGGGGMGAPGGNGIGVGAGGPGDLVDIEYLFERFGDTIFAPRLTEEEEDDLLYTYT